MPEQPRPFEPIDEDFLQSLRGLIESRTKELTGQQVAERSRGCMDPQATRLAASIAIKKELAKSHELGLGA